MDMHVRTMDKSNFVLDHKPKSRTLLEDPISDPLPRSTVTLLLSN